jgi:hypothetical protein
MFKITDNYLSEEDNLILKTIMESNEFPWFFVNKKVSTDEGLFKSQFEHLFYINNNINSNFFNYVKPLLDKLKPKALIRIKANLNPPSEKIVESAYHKDQEFKCKVAIYYVNDNNGYTLIGKEKILSKKNRIVLFNSDVKHLGTNSTNCNNRMVINFNYF